MAVIRVNPASLMQYAATATEQFAIIRSQLERLVAEVVAVRYFGPNATVFKHETGSLALECSQAMVRDLGHIADAVAASTTSIAQALGGSSVRLTVDGGPIALPTIPVTDETFDVDPAALEHLKPMVVGCFTHISGALEQHVAGLAATDWHGQAKQAAVDAVAQFTMGARTRCDQAQGAIVGAIDRQVQAVLAADR